MNGAETGGRSARLLIVDDEAHDRQLMEVMLAPEGFTLQSAAGGDEALALIASAPPDLILLDVLMPGTDGCQVAEWVKGNPATKNIPIIMISADVDRRARMLGLGAGAEDYLSKPVDRAELCVRVRNLLRLKAYGDYQEQYSQMLEREVSARTAALAESELLYRSSFHSAPVGVVHLGLDGQWLRVNQRLADLLGYPCSELEGPAAQRLLQSEDVAGEATGRRQLGDRALDRYIVAEKRYRRRDGTFLWAKLNLSAHHDGEGRPLHLIAVVEDITALRALEAQVLQASKMEAVGQLASGIAHDFNNVLSVVLGYGELLVAELDEGDPKRADLEEICAAGNRGASLTRQLLTFTRHQILQPQVVDLGKIVRGMEPMLQRLIGEDVELVVRTAPDLGPILVDPGHMEQIVMNLAVNARDAMPQGGRLTIETAEIDLDVPYVALHVGAKPGPHVLLSVSDGGVGMDKATQARMFEPFFTTKEIGKGTGLGLSIVFGIVRQCKGTIWVDSKLGGGTTLNVYLPMAGKLAVSHHPPFSLPPHVAPRGGETILLVEDEEAVRALARTILQKQGYQVLVAQSAGDALLLCEQPDVAIDLLLTDVVMPRISGRELAERLRPLRPHMKVLFMSGYTDDAVVRHGVLDSTVAFIQKPLTPRALGNKVREVLGTDSATAASVPRPAAARGRAGRSGAGD